MEFSIRRVKEEDAGSIVDLLNPIIQAGMYTILDEPISVDDQIGFIRGFPERGVYLAALGNGSQNVLGIQDVVPISTAVNELQHVGEISTFVRLASRRNGIGRSLSQATFRAAKAQGFLKIRATVRADNAPAIAFYRSQGFEVIRTAQKHALVGGKYLDEILTERFID
mgnify:CR=1 FL=1